MASKSRHQPPLTHVLEGCLMDMKAKLRESTDAFPDLSGFITFFVSVGYDEFLGKDAAFAKLYHGYMTSLQRGVAAAPPGVIYQVWRYMENNRVLRKACGLYTHKKVLPAGQFTPHDSPEDFEDDDTEGA